MTDFSLAAGCIRCFLFLIFIMTVPIPVHTYAADETAPKTSKSQTAISGVSHPFCGLYCLYTTMKLAGKEIDFGELVKPEYLGSRKGSSITELKKAAEDCGLYAELSGRLTDSDLRQCPYHTILHVKSEPTSRMYDHYELFLGVENNKAKLLNIPEPVRLVTFNELVPRWDGNALIVSSEPINLGFIYGPARKRLIMYATAAIAIILALNRAKRWLPGKLLSTRIRLLGLSVTQAGIFALVALLFGMLYHFARDTGLLANAHATASIQQAHIGNFIPKIGKGRVHKLLNDDTIFIDARLARDYKTGHIEGAMNVPVDANDVEFQKATADIAKDTRIVTYCQSARCKFAEKVAIKMIEDGFSNISIYKNGWADWVAKNDKKGETAS